MRRLAQCIVSFALLTFVASGAMYAQDQQVVLEASSLRHAMEPVRISDYILFSYELGRNLRDGQVHSVAAAFEHENFSVLHEYSFNDYGVLILLLPASDQIETYRYRLIVDGVWGPDPRAPGQTRDRWGIHLSEFSPSRSRQRTSYPLVAENGEVEFRLRAESGRFVSIVGSFNGWDPFMTPMHELEPGVYGRTLRLTKGEHLYYYMVDGRRFADPVNGETRWDVNGLIVSAVSLP